MKLTPPIARHRPSTGRSLRRAVVWAWLGVGLLASVASAASLVEVRVGRHPTFTRVVFELDAPAGYRVQREASEGHRAILVTLEASSTLRQIASKSLVVESVEVGEGLGQAVARIILRRPSPQVREMILGNPPRIVFDVMLGEEALAIAGVPAPKPPPVPAQAEPPPSEPEPIAPVLPAIAPAEPEPEKVLAEAPVAEPPEPVETPAEEEPAELEPVEIEKTVEPVEEVPAPEAPAPEERRLAESPRPPSPSSEPPRALRPPGEQARVARPPSRARARPPAPKPPTAVPATESRFDVVTVGAIAAGVLALVVIFVLLVRRRAIPNDLDVAALAEEMGDEDWSAIPAEGFSVGAESAGPSGPEDTGETIVEEPRLEEVDVSTGPELFDETAKGEGEMDQQMEDLPISRSEPMAAAVPPVSGDESDVTRLVRELERRIAHLETRLDESVDARERLERQVAAQSEELRVQRAAIARTQRALRSLSRSEEEQVTEPALREPGS